MTTLITAPNLESGDDFYEALIDAHRGFTTTESHALNARLILLLANHIGSQSVIGQALTAARQSFLRTQPKTADSSSAPTSV